MKTSHQFHRRFPMALAVTALLAASCAPAAPPAQPAAPPAAARPGWETMQPVALRSNDFGPLNREIVQPYHWLGDELAKRTDGKVKIDYRGSAELGGALEQLDNVGKGVFPLAIHCFGFQPGKSPLTTVGTLPLITDDMVAMGKAFFDLAELPEIKAELDKLNVTALMPLPVDSYHLLSRKPVASLADLKGMKVRSIGYQAKALEKVGAVPMAMPTTEIYTAMERGVLDGALWVIQGELKAYGFTDITKYAVEIYAGALAPCAVIMNKQTFDGLPADVQKLMKDLARQTPDQYREVYKKGRAKDEADLGTRGVRITSLPAAERQQFKAIAGAPVGQEWVVEMNGKGLPGQKIYSFWIQKIRQYEQK